MIRIKFTSTREKKGGRVKGGGEEKRGKGGRGWMGWWKEEGQRGEGVEGTGVTHYMLSKQTK